MQKKNDDIVTISNIYMGVLIGIAVTLSLMVIMAIEVIKIGEHKECYKACHEVMIEQEKEESIGKWWGIVWEYELCSRRCEKEG